MKKKPYASKTTYSGVTTCYDDQGRRHNDNGPAYYTEKGVLCWWIHGERHNSTGPAVIKPNGVLEYWWHNTQIDEFQLWFKSNEEGLSND